MAAVLKTVELKGSGGSNPSLSANEVAKNASSLLERVFLMPKFANFAAGGEGLLVLLFEGEG